MQRRTKIICTIGPATDDYRAIEQMYNAGMDVVRVNMSHADQTSALRVINWIKTLNRKVKYPVPILLDTQGPEIRTGTRELPLKLETGASIDLTVSANDADPSQIFVSYPDLLATVRVGDRVTIDNGLINLDVIAKTELRLTCRIVDGGMLGSRKHVNLPGMHVNLPSITAKDETDILFGLAQDIDFVAMSFVRSAEDIHEMRELMATTAKSLKIVAKIENREGVEKIDEIAEAADAVMVARGDLGIETDIAALPNVQRHLVRTCARIGRRCIVATHLLESMIENPIPTRAEVTDVANAIYEGVDAIMLSGETSVGRYPDRCVEQLARIAEVSERFPGLGFAADLEANSDKQHLARSAVNLARDVNAAGIVVITRRGVTADLVTNCDPAETPIYAFTNNSQTRRRLMLNRGMYSHRTAFSRDPEKTIQTAFRVLREREGLLPADKVVVISDVIAQARIDAVQLRPIGNYVVED